MRRTWAGHFGVAGGRLGIGRLGVVVGLAALMGCGGDGSPTEPNGDGSDGDARVVKAIALSPAGFPESFDLLPSFMSEAASFSDAGILWNGAWRGDVQGGTDAGQPPDPAIYVAQQADVLDFAPVAVFGWRSDESLHVRVPDNPVNDWSNEEAAELFVEMAETYAEQHEPPFVFLGNESDIYFDQDPVDYARWVAVFEEAYDRIKAVSPETLVGPVFQYERMAGIGVLTGNPDIWQESSWGALTAHDLDKLDVVGLTFYPFFAYETPDQIPDDYLDPIVSRIGDIPLAITETGWPAEHAGEFAPPWEASETHQVSYIDTLERIFDGRAIRLTTWLFLHPPVQVDGGALGGDAWSIFQSLSLRDPDGAPRPVYEAWENAEFTPGPS